MKKLFAKLAAATALALVATTGPLTQTADAQVDVYITPGKHTVNGRQWSTTCEAYSSNVTRCRTEIWATQVTEKNGRYVTSNGWVFNNLTYKASPRATWINNNLGRSSQWVSNGRDWYTECDTPTTGRNGCRSYIWGTAISAQQTATGTKYAKVEGWQFNNMVRFTDDVYAQYSGTGTKTVTLPKGLKDAYITLSYQGSDTFDLSVIDGGGQVSDGISGTGKYQGSMLAGWATKHDLSKLELTGKGKWTVTVKPSSAAPKFQGSASGKYDEAFLYFGGNAKKTFTYTGTGEVVVITVDDYFNTSVDSRGPYKGTIELTDETVAIFISIDGGSWSIS